MAVEETFSRSKDGVPREKASRCQERSKKIIIPGRKLSRCIFCEFAEKARHEGRETLLRRIIRERDFPASVDKVKIMSIVRNSIDLASIISGFATFLINPAKFASRPPGPYWRRRFQRERVNYRLIPSVCFDDRTRGWRLFGVGFCIAKGAH